MEPLATDHVLINKARIAHGVYGEGIPIVLIHGTPSSSLIWRNVVPRLVAGGFKVHVFDKLGYGLSERPWDPAVDTSISGQVPIVEGLFSHWGLDAAHIVAHDIGGAVAQRLAVFSPHLLLSLTLIDVVSFDSYPSQRTRIQMEKGLSGMIKASDEEHAAHFKEWLFSTVEHKDRFASSSLDTLLGYISGPIGQGSLFQHQVRHYDNKHTMEITDRMHEIGRMPVKLIWGAQDSWQVTDWAFKLQKSIPGSQLDIIQDCGHFSPEDQPEKVAQLILEFLKSLKSELPGPSGG